MMEGIKLKNTNLKFIGAYIKDEDRPLIGSCIYSIPNKTLTIYSNNSEEPVITTKVTAIKYENVNQFISTITFYCEEHTYSFHIGIFPEETYPIDNVTDSLTASFEITDNKKVIEYMAKYGPHSVINYMAKLVEDSLGITK